MYISYKMDTVIQFHKNVRLYKKFGIKKKIFLMWLKHVKKRLTWRSARCIYAVIQTNNERKRVYHAEHYITSAAPGRTSRLMSEP